MKKIFCAILALTMIFGTLTGCSQKKDRILYKNDNLEKYVDLGEYKGISVDTASDGFVKFYSDIINADVEANELYVKKTEGTIAEGDTVNIDYVGKKDSVAFNGGTASDYNLTIGSGTFIDGFEDGLIGKQIGSTVDLNLTFPENYSNEDLKGAAVVFTVTINYVKTDEPREPEEYYSELDFETYEDYVEYVTERAIKNSLFETFTTRCKIKKYPQDDIDYIYGIMVKNFEAELKANYQMGFSDYVSYMGQTEEEFKENALKNNIKPMMDTQLLAYSVIDAEGLEIDTKAIDAEINKILNNIGDANITKQDIIDYYGEYYFESYVVNNMALDILYDNAKITK